MESRERSIGEDVCEFRIGWSVCEVTGGEHPTHVFAFEAVPLQQGMIPRLASWRVIRTGRRVGQTEKRQQSDSRHNNLFRRVVGVGLALGQET